MNGPPVRGLPPFRLLLAGVAAAALSAALLGLPRPSQDAVEFTEGEIATIQSLSPLGPPPPNPTNPFADDPGAAHFGQYLFYEKRLSRNGEVSCATCHDPEKDWADAQPHGKGLGELGFHTPSLWNTAQQRWYFWNGRADSLWSQALQPMEHPKEMGLTRLELAHLFQREADLRRGYEAVFGALPDFSAGDRFPVRARPRIVDPDPAARLFGRKEEEPDPLADAWEGMAAEDQETVNRFFSNLGKAIEAFQRRIVSTDSPFDGFVAALAAGDSEQTGALGTEAQRGLKVFLQKECTNCHHGPLLSDKEFHNIGLALGEGLDPDAGRPDGVHAVRVDPFNGRGRFSAATDWEMNRKLRYLFVDEHVEGSFKTPSLRNVARTAPYMHDGRFATLEEVLDFYSRLPGGPPAGHREETMQPARFTPREAADLIAFLESLSGSPPDPKLSRQPADPVLAGP